MQWRGVLAFSIRLLSALPCGWGVQSAPTQEQSSPREQAWPPRPPSPTGSWELAGGGVEPCLRTHSKGLQGGSETKWAGSSLFFLPGQYLLSSSHRFWGLDRNREGVGLEKNGGPGGHEDRCEDRARGARERQGAHGRDKPAEKNAGAQPRQQGRRPTPTFPAGVGDGGQPESSRPVPG